MAQRLTNLQIGEVSLVDAPANPGARAILFKRDFSAGERRADARSGAALPDGSFPIESGGDLENAIRAIGRAKDPAKARRHIISRARSLGLTSKLPDGWTKKSLFEKLREFLLNEDEDDVSTDLVVKIDEAAAALRKSVDSIVADTELTDKSVALDATFSEYVEHIQGVVPEALEKAFEGAITKRSSKPMTEEERKVRAEARKEGETPDKEREDMKKALDAANAELALLKMSPAHRDHYSQLAGEAQAQFAALPVDKRDAHIAANPIRKSADAEAIEKANKVAADAMAEVAKLRDEQAFAEVAKRVGAFGGSADLAKALHAVAKASPDAAKLLEQTLKGQAEQASTGKLFAEFGSAQGADASSPDAMMKAAVAEVRKSDPKIKSDASAISKIAGMPEHRELWNSYKAATTTKAA